MQIYAMKTIGNPDLSFYHNVYISMLNFNFIYLSVSTYRSILKHLQILMSTHNKVKPFVPILQQTTLNVFCQKIENLYNSMDNLLLKVENIVAKREIAHLGQFLLLSLCFQNAVCCRGDIYEGKG